MVGEVQRHQGALLDAGRAVAQDVVEVLLQLVQDLLDAFLGQRVLVAGLAGRQDEEVLDPLVLDQRLAEVGLALDDVDEVVHHAALAAHDQVEVAQTNVEVDDDGLEPAQRQSSGEGSARRGLAHAALARCHHDYLGQGSLSTLRS